ncbi:hypothetical protein GCM10010255_01600 [Streptomyces coeruleofuscus]|uniref:Uncharacterized protein n=1 Tax=Streptomyces coeruleofuscus TaxID=66879 RepID=A0ABN3HH55_9ACTN
MSTANVAQSRERVSARVSAIRPAARATEAPPGPSADARRHNCSTAAYSSSGLRSARCCNSGPDRSQRGRSEASSPGVTWLWLTLRVYEQEIK